MTDLTISQKIARPLINFIVEKLFPNGCFYGKHFMSPFLELDIEAGDAVGRTAAMYLQSIMRKADAVNISVELHEVTENGEPVGSFRLLLEKITPDQKGGE